MEAEHDAEKARYRGHARLIQVSCIFISARKAVWGQSLASKSAPHVKKSRLLCVAMAEGSARALNPEPQTLSGATPIDIFVSRG